MDFLIRKMETGDVSGVYNIGINQKEFSSRNGIFWSEKQLEKWCQSSDDILLIAEKEGKIIGFSFYANHTPTGKITWENLYVEPEFRGFGVGRALAKKGLEKIKNLGLVYIMMCVNSVNQEAFVSFAEKMGFKKGPKVLWMDLEIKNQFGG